MKFCMCKISLTKEREINMITKVSYRPYASGVSNRQTQPQKVSFKAAANEKAVESGAQLFGTLIALFTVGKNRAESLLPNVLRNIPEFLEQLGIHKLAKSFEKEITHLKDPEMLTRFKAAAKKTQPETIFDVLAGSYNAGIEGKPMAIFNLADATVGILERNGANEQAAGLRLAPHAEGIGKLFQMLDKEIARRQNPWLVGVMEQFVEEMKGRQ